MIVKACVGKAVPVYFSECQDRRMATLPILGQRIRTLREHAGMTQADLGAAIGVSRTHVTNIERGKDYPGRELLLALATQFSVSLDWLSGGPGDDRPAKATNEREAMMLFAFRKLPEEEAGALLNLLLKRVRQDG